MQQTENQTLSRTKAREGAFFVVFQKDFSPELKYDTAEALNKISQLYSIDNFSRSLVEPVFNNLTAIDDVISSCLIGWTLDRLSCVTRALLRLASGELAYTSTDAKVIFNEYVNLAKIYAEEKDAAFLNGVLASVSKIVRTK